MNLYSVVSSMIIIAGSAVVVSCLGSQVPEQSPADPAEITLVPVLHLGSDSKSGRIIHLQLTNNSQRTFWYLAGALLPAPGIGNLEMRLYRDGVFVEPAETDEPIPLSKSRVRGLKPGQSASQFFNVDSYRPNLRAGRYEVRARYRVPEGSVLDKEYGLTPVGFQRTVAYIEIH